MKIKYLGTGAAERVPAIFCKCAVCQNAWEKQGKEMRTQTQVLINDGDLMIDFPGDSYHHMMKYNLSFNDIDSLLLTHWHSDHLYAEDLAYRMSDYAQKLTNKLDVYGNEAVKDFFDRAFILEQATDNERIQYHKRASYEKFQIKDYQIYSLPAQHGHFEEDCFIYVIQHEGKTLLYMHDTGYPTEEMFNYLKFNEFKFDLVSMDCTSQKMNAGKSHMNIEQNLQLMNQLKKLGLIKRETLFVANHFSHNGGATYKEIKEVFDKYNVIVSYDGMELEF
ncbi:MBL fold metallo-hydrolase [Ligilactobacillus sp. WILCCON 0076]|uniref:MBL fold metallo-hydrolase n=1 Tax=Ligilactobacillus ubinensis TaxID=2876789 RepID=A0A9X2FH50_9LACO|nr:MBL fold metallo-hydrolase [Ligilactobacillus ubinensis]MCP0885775.1 MBL fold metallo-hydrolase [Ligilactobacillus ubinensis]